MTCQIIFVYLSNYRKEFPIELFDNSKDESMASAVNRIPFLVLFCMRRRVAREDVDCKEDAGLGSIPVQSFVQPVVEIVLLG